MRRLEHGAADVRQFVLPLFEACLRGAELAVYAGAAHFRQGTPSVEIPPATESGSSVTLMVGEGHRPEALAALLEWMRGLDNDDTLVIIDPYFDPSSIDLLKLVQETSAEREVLIVTGPEALRRASPPYVEAYRASWRLKSTGNFPIARIMVLQTRTSGAFPVHDRWWLAGDRGLHVGTSVNGLGGRLSTVREISPDEVLSVRGKVDPYITGRKLIFEGERLDIITFDM